MIYPQVFKRVFDVYVKTVIFFNRAVFKNNVLPLEIPSHLIVLYHPKQYVFLKCHLVKLMTSVTVHQLQ